MVFLFLLVPKDANRSSYGVITHRRSPAHFCLAFPPSVAFLIASRSVPGRNAALVQDYKCRPHSIKLIYYSVMHEKNCRLLISAALAQGTPCTPGMALPCVRWLFLTHQFPWPQWWRFDLLPAVQLLYRRSTQMMSCKHFAHTVDSKIIRALDTVRVKKFISKALLWKKYLSICNL